MTPIVVVYGGTGHTGALVARALIARDLKVVLAGRDERALRDRASHLGRGATTQAAPVDDGEALRRLLSGADAVVNCAGPFSVTGEPVIEAALASGTHYLDHAAEPVYQRLVFERYAKAAEGAGLAIVPSMSFFCAVADTLVGYMADGARSVERVVVAYALRDWLLTRASKAAALRVAQDGRLIRAGGELRHLSAEMPRTTFRFPDPFGEQEVFAEYGSGEPITVPRHTPAPTVDVFMTAETFASPEAFTSESVPASRRSDSRFLVVAQVRTGQARIEGWVRGTDIYGLGAEIASEAAFQLVTRKVPAAGVLAPAEVCAPQSFLGWLGSTPFVAELCAPDMLQGQVPT